MPNILIESSARVATVTINRPEKLNALNVETKADLRTIFTGLEENGAIGCVILTGAGEKAFVAGTDISELTSLDRESGEAFARSGQELFDAIEGMSKPVIAAVNGYALGGGCELALACHIRLGSDRARFGQPEVNLGIIPGYGGTQRLTRLIGRGRATEMVVTGSQVDAQEALRIGLLNAVFPAAELMTRAQRMAEVIAANPGRAIALALAAIAAAQSTILSAGLRREAELFGECCMTEDFREGTKAFLEKRKPKFTHR
jgi:enoyl-CoA hydratase